MTRKKQTPLERAIREVAGLNVLCASLRRAGHGLRKRDRTKLREPSALYTVSPRAPKPDTRNPTPSSL